MEKEKERKRVTDGQIEGQILENNKIRTQLNEQEKATEEMQRTSWTLGLRCSNQM